MPRKNKQVSRQPWERGTKKPQTVKLKRILVLCEDEKSSRDYLNRFPVHNQTVQIECVGTGFNTDSLVEEAIKRKVAAAANPFAEIWVVFDRDSFPAENFNRAFDLARSHNEIYLYWANEGFELWYLLHFAYRDTGISRHKMGTMLTRHLGKKYDKADASIYAQLLGKLPTALKNARKLFLSHGHVAPEKQNPSTNVHELIEKLLQFDPKHFIND